MKTPLFSVRGSGLAVATLALAISGLARAENARIPFSEVGAKATADYQGDALGITVTPDGARLRCGFQKLDGRATPQGLWLESTVAGGGEFHLVAATVRREGLESGPEASGPLWNEPAPSESGRGLPQSMTLSRWCPCLAVSSEGVLPVTGLVSVEDKLVRFTRPGVTEEYSVSVDGVQQDFVIGEPPAGAGDLRVELALTGARAEAAAYGAKVILEGSGRALAYSRLRVTDATGQELKARLEVLSADRLAVRVVDANATYPVRIDPTFSDANWVSLNPDLRGADNRVYAIAVDSSGNVYVGGDFTIIGTVVANRIAKWNGSGWSALGSGMDGGDWRGTSVYALAVSGTTLYAGGDFTTAGGMSANCMATWNGIYWSAVGGDFPGGGGMDNVVYALAVSGTNLYAGGAFTTAGEVPANYIAKWNGSAWSALGSGMGGFDSAVYALAVSGTSLYAGGYFTTAGGVTANFVAKWSGSAWSALGAGMNGGGALPETFVSALAMSGTTLYAGGNFTTAGGMKANYIAKWNGSAWSNLGSGMDKPVNALAVSGTTLYAGGDFTTAGGVSANSIAKWNGSSWSALRSGVSGGFMESDVFALAVSGTSLYAGGYFTTAGGVPANYIAKWSGSAWSALLGSWMNQPVRALAVSGPNLYVGANYIAKWDGSTWSALGSVMNGTVWALAAIGTDLYAGGSFTTVGGVSANYIAKWSGSVWSALGSGMNQPVGALAVSGTNLYAGGSFFWADWVPVNYIAKWDGSTWSALGTGMAGGGVPPYVSSIACDSSGNVYAGGDFTTAGGVTANYIAKWNGRTWSALDSGMNDEVYALAVSGTDVYAGGRFTMAGGVAANGIAAWNGSAWSALGSGMGGTWSNVNALAVSGTTLYAGGRFTTAGGEAANGIAAWNGSAWSALGSGMGGVAVEGGDPFVSALAADGAGHLFVGGDFFLAGTNLSPFLAEANIGAGLSAGRLGSLGCSPATGFGCTFSDGTIGQPYRMQVSPSLSDGSWTTFTNFTYTGPIVISDPSAAAGLKKFYRVASP